MKKTITDINENKDLISKIKEKYKVYTLYLNNDNNINLNINTWLGESQIDDLNKTINIIKDNNLIIDWLIIDHYAIDKIWEEGIKKYIKNICVIDDFTNREHNCNILLNQQILYEEGIIKYKNIINKDCILYCGNDYLLLHSKYFNYTNYEKQFQNYIKRVNIFMGGSDIYNITDKIIDICYKYNNCIQNKIIFAQMNKISKYQ